MGNSHYSSPAIASDGTVYIWSEKLYALNPTTGSMKWSVITGGTPYYSSPAIASDGTVYIWSGSIFKCKLYALNPTDGSMKWSFDTGSADSSTGAVSASAVIAAASNA